MTKWPLEKTDVSVCRWSFFIDSYLLLRCPLVLMLCASKQFPVTFVPIINIYKLSDMLYVENGDVSLSLLDTLCNNILTVVSYRKT